MHHGFSESDRTHAPPLSVTTRPEPLVTLKNGAQLHWLFFVVPAPHAARLSAAPLLRPLPNTLHCANATCALHAEAPTFFFSTWLMETCWHGIS